MLQATNFTQSIPAKVTVEYCRLDQGGAPGVDGGDVLHDGLHLVRHLQVLQVIGNLAVFGLLLFGILCFGMFYLVWFGMMDCIWYVIVRFCR